MRARVYEHNVYVFARPITASVNFGIYAPENCESELMTMRAPGGLGGDRGGDVVVVIVMVIVVMIVVVIVMVM